MKLIDWSSINQVGVHLHSIQQRSILLEQLWIEIIEIELIEHYQI